MKDERNQYQIIRKDARGCFVESLSDRFPQGNAHFGFAAYDSKRPAGQRQTQSIHIYMSMSEVMELCRKLSTSEMRYIIQQKQQTGDSKPIQSWMGGTSAKKLRVLGKPRADGRSLSRVCNLLVSKKGGFLFTASSGPGDEDSKGLIVPRYGSNPENHVSISMTYEAFSELLLTTQAHYQAWLSSWYATNYQAPGYSQRPTSNPEAYGGAYGQGYSSQGIY